MSSIGPLKVLTQDELMNLMSLSTEKRHNYLISGYADFDNKHIMCFRGSGTSFVIPFSIFKPSGTGLEPDFEQLEFIDYGQTIKLGEYEASVHGILYDLDEEYRHKWDNDLNTWEGQQHAARNRAKIFN
jgi:hypothetical protein